MLNDPRFNAFIARKNKEEIARIEENIMWHTFHARRSSTKISKFKNAVTRYWKYIFVCSELSYLGIVANITTSTLVTVAATLLGLVMFAGLAFKLDE